MNKGYCLLILCLALPTSVLAKWRCDFDPVWDPCHVLKKSWVPDSASGAKDYQKTMVEQRNKLRSNSGASLTDKMDTIGVFSSNSDAQMQSKYIEYCVWQGWFSESKKGEIPENAFRHFTVPFSKPWSKQYCELGFHPEDNDIKLAQNVIVSFNRFFNSLDKNLNQASSKLPLQSYIDEETNRLEALSNTLESMPFDDGMNYCKSAYLQYAQVQKHYKRHLNGRCPVVTRNY